MTHKILALMMKTKKRVWTNIKKTGLFAFRTRSSVHWRCPLAPPVMMTSESTQINTENNTQCNNEQVVSPEFLRRESMTSLDRISET